MDVKGNNLLNVLSVRRARMNLTIVVRSVDNATQRINCYRMDSVVYFVNTYTQDRDLSGG